MKNNKKRFTLGLCLVLIVAFTVGGTMSYLISKPDKVENTFTKVEVTPEIEEEFDKEVKKNVKVTNIGDIDVYVRADIIITWKSEDGKQVLPAKSGDYSLIMNNLGEGKTWFEKDGIYYYKDKVAPNASTNNLIDECKPIKDPPKDGYTLSVEILAQAVQATPVQVVQELWSNVKVDTTGTLVPVGKN